MAAPVRITARVDDETKKMLEEAARISGAGSINSFVVSAAIQKARKILDEHRRWKVGCEDVELFLRSLDSVQPNEALQQAFNDYISRKRS